MLNCFTLPNFSHRTYLLLILIVCGVPLPDVECIFSGFDLIQTHAPNSPPNRPSRLHQARKIARSKRRSYRRHTKFKPTQRTVQSRRGSFDGWASLPSLPPHVVPLLPCLARTPVVSVRRDQVFEIMWAEACWNRILEDFLATLDPSKIMDIYRIFELKGENDGVVTVPINKQALISSLEDE